MTKGQYLGELELYVMAAVSLLGDDGYGVTIQREIQTRSGRPVAMGAIYATLSRLEEKGYVASTLSDPLPVRGGRSRKYVKLTRAGHRALHHSTAMLTRMIPVRSVSGGRRR